MAQLLKIQTCSKILENNTGIVIIFSVHLKISTFPREEDILESLVFREQACCTLWKSCSFANTFPRVGGSQFSRYNLSVDDPAGSSASHLGYLREEASTQYDCGRPGLWFCVCPVSAEAASVCGLASLLLTPPMRSHTVCSRSQDCLLPLVPGNQPLPSFGEAHHHSMDDRYWEIHPSPKLDNFKAAIWKGKL